MLLTVIVPVFNTEEHLARCLDSVVDQDLDPTELEILVVDDGSEDGSLSIAEEYAARHPNLRVISQHNQGVAVARNNAMRQAAGRHLFFLDSDDYIAPGVLGTLTDLATRESLQIVAFDHVRVDVDGPPAPPVDPVALRSRPEVTSGLEHIAHRRYLSESCCYLFDRRLVLDLGAEFDVGRIIEDVVFTATVVSAADRIANVPVALYRYVQRPGSIMNTRGDVHTRKLVVDYERVVFRLDELRQRWLQQGNLPAGFDDRLRNRQQTFVFFLIARLARSGLPVRPLLPDSLRRIHAIGMYPMDAFPGRDFDGLRYRVLTAIFNRSYLLYPFVAAVRVADRLRRALRRG